MTERFKISFGHEMKNSKLKKPCLKFVETREFQEFLKLVKFESSVCVFKQISACVY
jgi:hypothetical protein